MTFSRMAVNIVTFIGKTQRRITFSKASLNRLTFSQMLTTE
jgi:hypothetical protein